MSSVASEEGGSVKQSRHIGVAEHEAVDSSDSDGIDDADDADEWEDVDDEWVTDSEPDADCVHSTFADDNCQCDTTTNCPDILTGPQLIGLLRSLCLSANRHADVHTVGLVCMFHVCSVM